MLPSDVFLCFTNEVKGTDSLEILKNIIFFVILRIKH